MTRKEFNLEAAQANVVDGTIKMDFKKLSTIAIINGFNEMDSPKEARECFISDVLSALKGGQVFTELSDALYELKYSISVFVPAGWRSARVCSDCVAIGGKAYVYNCEVSSPPGSKRQNYSPASYARREYGKAKILSKF